MPMIYAELKTLAARVLRGECLSFTLGATALVHEAYLRLIDQRQVEWNHRAQFLGLAAQMMRRIIVDHARHRGAAKRGGGFRRITLTDAPVSGEDPEVDLVELDAALVKLAEFDPQQSRIVELRFFGGLTIEETADILQSSPATVKREWTLARAWLRRELHGN